MPEVSRFLGISVRMFYDEHAPPHFHAVYGDHAVGVRIADGNVAGWFPPRSLRHLREWYHLHRVELLEDWNLARAGEPLVPYPSPRMNPSNPALVRVVEARHLGGHRVWLRFDDGLEGEVDLAGALRGPVFEPLRDPAYFARFQVDYTLIWPNGADLAPESLHERVRRARSAGA